ncbi:sec1 family domain-containing protein 2-like [Liolophura sinensis]|uniref:sec1 family domain-containing protein 2-like n=1 Tax=Liolophura sinensis TaxID=3198878 RepID=UPI003158FF9F
MKSLSDCAGETWKTVCSYVKHGVVFMDNACAECLHWHGGLPLLANAGAVEVKEFSPFESARVDQKKGIFIVSSLLFDETADVIKDIIQASSFQYVIVVTSVSPQVHLYAKTGALEGVDSAVFEQLEDKLLEWMGNMNYTSEVHHLPIFHASPLSGVFLTPAFTSLFPLLESDVKRIELQHNAGRHAKGERVTFVTLEDVDSNSLPKSLKIYYKSLASGMNDLLNQFGVREEVYCLGYTSRMIAMELEIFPAARHRRKTRQDAASVLFVDRSLDLASVTGHQGETLLDRIIQMLPRLKDSNDVLVDMQSITAAPSSCENPLVCPGCLAQPPHSSTQTLLNFMATSKQKESLMNVNRHLVEAATKEKLPLKLSTKPGRVTPDLLTSTLTLFKNNNRAIDNHCDLLQIAIATAQALSHPANSRYDNLTGVEKLLLQQLSEDSEPSPLSQITQLLNTEMAKPRQERNLSLDDFLALLLFTYSVMGDVYTSPEEDENEAKVALVNAIIKEKDALPSLVQDLVGGTVNRGVVQAVVEDMWYKLESVGSARSHLKQFGSLVNPGSAVSPTVFTPLLKLITEDIFNPQKPDLVDIEYKSSGFKDLLKTGFGFFMNVRKPRPSDHPLLVIFVVGGVTSTEVKQIRDVVSSHKSTTQVIIGSTHLVKQENILQKVLAQDNLLAQQCS